MQCWPWSLTPDTRFRYCLRIGMAFVNLSLLLGGAFVAIPIVLHLIMRQRPKQLVFPGAAVRPRTAAGQSAASAASALAAVGACAAARSACSPWRWPGRASLPVRFRVGSTAGLLGRRWRRLTALLAVVAPVARHVAAADAAALLASPSRLLLVTLFVAGRALAGKSPVLGDQEAPVAAAIVIDTSPRMQYRHENKTRLEAAQEMAQWLLRQLPAESELAILDSQPGSGAFAVDRAAAAKTIEPPAHRRHAATARRND